MSYRYAVDVTLLIDAETEAEALAAANAAAAMAEIVFGRVVHDMTSEPFLLADAADEYRGDVAMALRASGWPHLAEAYAAVSDEEAEADRLAYENSDAHAAAIIRGAQEE